MSSHRASNQSVTCNSRFHNNDRRQLHHNIVTNSSQYVCPACKGRWAENGYSLADICDLKRKLDVYEESPREWKRRKVECNPKLSPEMLSAVWLRCLDTEPKCAFKLLVPDWRICDGENPIHEEAPGLTQVATYMRGSDYLASTFSTTSGHDRSDHIFLPFKSLDDRLLVANMWSHNETLRLFFQEGAQVFQLGENNLPDDVTNESFLRNWRDIFPMRRDHMRSILPFDDEQPEEKRTTPKGRPYFFKLLRHIVVSSPLTLMNVDARSMVGPGTDISEANLEALNKAIDLDRTSHLWISWSKMPMLESVLLDLRIYSHDLNTDRGCISKGELIQRAREMGRWLKLKLLVIAGLQSYCFSTSYKSYTAEQIEQADEVDGEPNWIKIFMQALRPAGKLVLIDRQFDKSSACTVINQGYDVDMDIDD
ncbi:hypothetical protein F4818DRAFT_451906 [Hypoxylon cercidicola]|nr:hypothetical protein F4818DRAFT_451906 [Hypoxylon cercidicola]